MGFIKELYDGNIVPYERRIVKGSEYEKLSESCMQMYKELRQELDREVAEKLEKLFDSNVAVASLESKESYIMGFRDGARLMLDVLTGENSDLTPLIKEQKTCLFS